MLLNPQKTPRKSAPVKQKLPTDADLTEASFEYALEILRDNFIAHRETEGDLGYFAASQLTLTTSYENWRAAIGCAHIPEVLDKHVITVLSHHVEEDEWHLSLVSRKTGEKFEVWSPGA